MEVIWGKKRENKIYNTKYAEQKGTHKDHPVQCLALDKTLPSNNLRNFKHYLIAAAILIG